MKSKFCKIKTERLSLRKLKEADWKVVSYLRTDEKVNKFVKRPSAETKEKALEFIHKINNGIKNQTFFYWCISKKDATEMIGSICLWNFSDDKKTAEVGYDLSPLFQGKGIMDEALKTVLEFGFKNLHLEKIEAYTQHDNQSSVKLLERNQFRLVVDKMDEGNEKNMVYEKKIPKQ